METMDTINTWEGFFALLILLILCYWLLKAFVYAVKRFTKKNATNRKITDQLKRALLFFKPFAVLLLLLDLISINPLNHTIFLVVIGVFGFKHINNYINGIVLKTNPLIKERAVLESNTFQGEIKRMLAFGIVMNTESGERYMNYSEIEQKGFLVKSIENSLLRQTLYIESQLPKDTILDILFDNPILNNEEFPTIKSSGQDHVYKLQYSLEKGASSEDLIAFLEEKNIISNKTLNTTN
ncbi:hypothetical protein [uncultured Dokdonia sp.]|uniref:hypothetical protein n=1 Tax=uncultured Dokdonia sp. TaxID=575653 RepID=UPI002609858F|nr:hypothetical protein [uncultured Dokdonia sp.]